MVQIISGAKGKGKTKYLLDMANTAVKESKGSIVYLDKSSKHMYELNNRIRLINVQEYPITSSEGLSALSAGSFARIMIWSRCTWTVSSNWPALRARAWKRHIRRWRRLGRSIILRSS